MVQACLHYVHKKVPVFRRLIRLITLDTSNFSRKVTARKKVKELLVLPLEDPISI